MSSPSWDPEYSNQGFPGRVGLGRGGLRNEGRVHVVTVIEPCFLQTKHRLFGFPPPFPFLLWARAWSEQESKQRL